MHMLYQCAVQIHLCNTLVYTSKKKGSFSPGGLEHTYIMEQGTTYDAKPTKRLKSQK